MKRILMATVAAVLFFMLAQQEKAQAQRKPGPQIDLFKTVKPGQWIQVDGVLQRNMSVRASEVKVLTGDLQNDDWELLGVVRRLNNKRKEFYIMNIRVRTSKETEFEHWDDEKADLFKDFSNLKNGMLVEVEGTFLKDGTFLALEVQNETGNPKRDLDEVSVTGKVQKINPSRKTVTVMGTVFEIRKQTDIKSAIK